jgi:single-stranded-DNA-specific exonuclease
VAELGHDLFQELKLLEPCGMGNPVPKILIQNCFFTNLWNKNQKDLRGRKFNISKRILRFMMILIPQDFQGYGGGIIEMNYKKIRLMMLW